MTVLTLIVSLVQLLLLAILVIDRRGSGGCSCVQLSTEVDGTPQISPLPQVAPEGAVSLGLHHPSAEQLQAAEKARVHRLSAERWNPYGKSS